MKTDTRGRPIEVKPPGSLHPVALEYYPPGSVLQGAFPGQLAAIKHGPITQPRTTIFKYTPEGWLWRVEAPQGMTTEYVSHDRAGRVLEAVFPGNRRVFFGYDADGNLTKVTPSRDPGDPRYGTPAPDGTGWPQHLFTFDDLDLPMTYAAPPLGGTSYQTSYELNAAKQLEAVTRPDGTGVSLGYEEGVGRLQRATLPVPAPLSPPATTTLDYGYHPETGQLTSVTDGFGESLSLSYQGFLLRGETWRGAPHGSGVLRGQVTVERDHRFGVSRRTITDAGNGSVSYTYSFDEEGVLNAAGDADGDGVFGPDDLSFVRSSDTGLPQAVSLGGIDSTLSFSPFGELSTLGTTWTSDDGGGGVARSYVEELERNDGLGRITRRQETLDGAPGVPEYYEYDSAGRLWRVYRGSTAPADLHEELTYDPNGNRIGYWRLGSPGSVTWTGVCDDQDRLVTYGPFAFQYTANGFLESRTNTASGEETTYTYDTLGALRRVDLPAGVNGGGRIEYVIDPRGRRAGRKRFAAGAGSGAPPDEEVYYLYQDGLRPVAELDASGALLRSFVHASRTNVPDYFEDHGTACPGGHQAGTAACRFRILSDHLGSPRLVVRVSDGAVAERFEHSAFGEELGRWENPDGRLDLDGYRPLLVGFAGGIFDRETGLVRFGARDY
ncbi:MAG: hypothetical protein RBU30_10805, partial [Polyangia bacterium]|nr:hypothetical protein [Polyangia bacterium]